MPETEIGEPTKEEAETGESTKEEAEAGEPTKEEAEVKKPTREELKEIEKIRKFRMGVRRSTEEAESRRWGPDGSERLPVDLAKLGAEQAEIYQKTQDRLKGFKASSVISELVSLKTDVSQLMGTFAQLEKKHNEVEADEDLSPKGKAKRIKEIEAFKSINCEQLDNCMTRIMAFEEAAEAEGHKQECLSEDEFSMISGDQGSRSNYALYSEMKINRLHREFGMFGSSRKFDPLTKKDMTEVDYEWLSRRYTSAMQRNDRGTMYFVEELVRYIQGNETSFLSKKGTGHLRGKVMQDIQTMRASRRDSSINDTLNDLRHLERKGREMRLRSRKSPSDRPFEAMRLSWD